MSILDALMLAVATDKGSNGHDYAPSYEILLRPFAGRSINLIEIGVGTGGSLEVWAEYLPDARVYGIDHDPVCLDYFKADGIFIGDQTDADFLRRVAEQTGAPHVVIDDGGHLASEQIASFSALFPLLAEGGLYVVEDTHVWYQDGYIDCQPDARTFFMGLVDAVNQGGKGGTGNLAQALASNDGRSLPNWSPDVLSVQFLQSLVAVTRR